MAAPENRGRQSKKNKVDPTAHLENAIVDLKSIRESHRRQFKKIMENIGRSRCLVVKKDQLRLINHVVKGVVKIQSVYLEPEFRCPADVTHVIYIIWPDTDSLEMIANQIKKQRNLIGPEDGRSFHIVMIPSVTERWRSILNDYNVLDIVNLIRFPCDLIPLDRDLITCAIPNVIRSSYLNRDYHPLNLLAEALLKMEVLFGRFTERHAKGDLSRIVVSLMNRFKSENVELYSSINDTPEIDKLILIDRLIDPISAVCTQRTYEGIIDELLGINNSEVFIQQELLGKAGQGRSRSDGKQVISLNSADPIFDECRNLNFEHSIGPWLSQTSNAVKQYFDSRHEAVRDMQLLKAFWSDITTQSKNHMLLTQHINIAQFFSSRSNKYIPWKRQMKIEHELLEGASTEDPEEYILELLARGKDFETVMRLLCLTSLCRSGLRRYETIKLEILQTYGYSHLRTLQNLEKAELIRPQAGWYNLSVQKNSYQNLKQKFSLFEELEIEKYQPQELSKLGNKDLNTIGSGYAPLSVRLIEQLHYMTNPKPWLEELNQLIPGESWTERVPTDYNSALEGSRPKRVLICFVGGVTYAEISALRLVSERSSDYDFIMMTTNITNGKTFIQEFVSEMTNTVNQRLDDGRNKMSII